MPQRRSQAVYACTNTGRHAMTTTNDYRSDLHLTVACPLDFFPLTARINQHGLLRENSPDTNRLRHKSEELSHGLATPCSPG